MTPNSLQLQTQAKANAIDDLFASLQYHQAVKYSAIRDVFVKASLYLQRLSRRQPQLVDRYKSSWWM